jgi:hypothetical protein
MKNSVPYEILGAPFEVWWAPVGTAFPAVDAEPAAAWKLIGTSGKLNQTADGVSVSMPQTTNAFRSAGSTGPRKVFRQEEDLKIALTLADHTLEQVTHALNENPITTVDAAAGTAGTKTIGLSRGPQVETISLLLRGPSPEMADGITQYEVPKAQQTGSPTIAYKNGEPSGVALEFTALVDETATSDGEQFGRLIVQTADADT